MENRRTPITIEFTGLPNSGKTTLIHSLDKTFSKDGFRVKVVREDSETVPKEIPKKTWERNAYITLGQLKSLIHISFCDSDIIFIDRGFYDALFWANFLNSQGVCSKEESIFMLNVLDGFNKTFDISPDILIVLDSSVEESLRRRNNQVGAGTPLLSKNDFLMAYKTNLLKFYTSVDTPKEFIDTTNLSVEEVEKLVHKYILDFSKKS